MRPFVEYYDLIYCDKDYSRDIDAFKAMMEPLSLSGASILELGAGTGNQSILLANEVTRLACCEIDPDFIRAFKQKELDSRPNLDFYSQPVQNMDVTNFNGAVAFFHVLNYMNETTLDVFLRGVARCLSPDAPLIADIWHAEAVIASPPRPERRRKIVGTYEIDVDIAPDFDVAANIVRLLYKITVRNGGMCHNFEEMLQLHLWPREQLAFHLKKAGFDALDFWDYREFPAKAAPDSWRIWLRAKKTPSRSRSESL